MLAALDDADVLVLDRVNDAILFVNPPAPETGKRSLQRLRLPNALKGISAYVLHKLIYPL